MTEIDKIKSKLNNNISVKLLVILLLILIMQIPLSSVTSLIYERQEMEHIAQEQISNRWGDEQHIGTPILLINRETQHQEKPTKTSFNVQSLSTNIDIQLEATKRYLGIFEAAIYISKIKLKGTIDIDFNQYIQDGSLLSTQLFIPLAHLRGLKKVNKIIINEVEITPLPSQLTFNDRMGIGIEIKDFKTTQTISYKIELSVAGSQQFNIIPSAQTTSVTMHSNWPSPSFIGDYLPDERTVNAEGFSANWQVNQLNLSSHSSNILVANQQTSFGVKILIPANIYQVNERTVKYSFLIIVLTFAGFFLSELFFKLRLHPFQYLLIGFAISTFYLLLLSISEYLSFNKSFFISATSIIVLISSYCSVVLKQRKRGLYTGVLFSTLYAFIFVLVKAEQASLLMGSIGLLFFLSLIMYLTRKIDWYKIGVNEH